VAEPRDPASAFHRGELETQERAGVRERAEALGNMFRPYLLEQHRAFFAALPFVLVGSLDAAGRPWASWLSGAPGFASSPDPHTLWVAAAPLPGDPLAEALREGAALGLLGIQLETRRRNRLNGHVSESTPSGFALTVDQSFDNCPKYITARAPLPTRGSHVKAVLPTRGGPLLSEAARACIAQADTCFIASASAAHAAADDRREGVDVSHRGGKSGFVHVREQDGASVLTMPDFAGNNAFNTLGNIARYPRAGYLFPSFDRGDLLLVSGRAEMVWQGADLARFRGAQRLLRLHVEQSLWFAGALPFRWSLAEPSPQLRATGSWHEAQAEQTTLDDEQTP
jgi:uncharacterized protein